MAWLLDLLAKLFAAFLGEQSKVHEAEAAGAGKLAAQQRRNDDAKIAEAMRARDSVDPTVVVRDDPDFRD